MFDNLRYGLAHAVQTLADETVSDGWAPAIMIDYQSFNQEIGRIYAEEQAYEKRYFQQGYSPQQFFPLVPPQEPVPAIESKQLAENIFMAADGLYNKNGERFLNAEIKVDCLYENESGEQEIQFCAILKDGNCIEKRMPVDIFREGKWTKRIYELQCMNSQNLHEYLEQLCGDSTVQKIRSLRVPGWYQTAEGLNFFTEFGDVMGKYQSVDITENGVKIFPVPDMTETELAKAFYEMKFLTKDGTSAVIMSYTVLAVLYTLFKEAGFTPKGMLAVIGPRSSLKTSLVLTMTNLYKRSKGMSPFLNFNSTITSIDEKLSIFKDSVMFVDDLMPSEAKAHKRQTEAVLEHVTRTFGDATTRRRSSKYCENYEPRGLVIITGEYIAGVSSSRSRRIVLSVQKDTVNSELLAYYQENLDILPGFLWNFLCFCARNQTELIKFISQMMQKKRRNYQSKYEISRYAEYQAELEVAYEIFLKYLAKVAVLSSYEIEVELAQFQLAIQQILRDNAKEQERKEPIQQVFLAINDSFYSSGFAFVNLATTECKGENYYSDEFLYIHPEWLLKAVQEYMQRQGETSAIADVPYMKIILENAGVLVAGQEGGATRRTVKIPGASKLKDNRRFFKLRKKEILQEP